MTALLLTMMMEGARFPKRISVWASFLYDRVDRMLNMMMIMVVMLRVVGFVVMMVMAKMNPSNFW